MEFLYKELVLHFVVLPKTVPIVTIFLWRLARVYSEIQ